MLGPCCPLQPPEQAAGEGRGEGEREGAEGRNTGVQAIASAHDISAQCVAILGQHAAYELKTADLTVASLVPCPCVAMRANRKRAEGARQRVRGVVRCLCRLSASRSLVRVAFGGLCVRAQGDLTTYNIRRLFANVGEGTSVSACCVACHAGKGGRGED